MSAGKGDKRDVVHELVERIDSIAPEVLKLVKHELGCLFLDCCGRYRQGLHTEIWGVPERSAR